MVFNIPHVNRPIFMSASRLKRHGFWLMWLFLRAFHAVKISVELQDSTTRPGRECDTNILEGRVDTPLAKLWICLQFADFIHGVQRDFSPWMLGGMTLVLKSLHAFLNPSFEDRVDG